MSDTVLFLCPHNAAKSVIAVAYLRHYAAQAGLDLTADSAGTEPDTAVWPAVIDLLHQDGLTADQRTPRSVTARDLEEARLVISMGCDLADLPDTSSAVDIERWDDLPLASKDLPASRDAIRHEVQDLVTRLHQTSTNTQPPR